MSVSESADDHAAAYSLHGNCHNGNVQESLLRSS